MFFVRIYKNQKETDGEFRGKKQQPAAERKAPGRPSLPKGEGKRHAIGLRATADFRRKLEEGAKQSGRSLSQEANFVLRIRFEMMTELQRASAVI